MGTHANAVSEGTRILREETGDTKKSFRGLRVVCSAASLPHHMGAAHGPVDAGLSGGPPRHEHHQALRSPATAYNSRCDGEGARGKWWAHFWAQCDGVNPSAETKCNWHTCRSMV